DALKARLERRYDFKHLSTNASLEHFDANAFRTLADRSLRENWIALDYYLTDESVIITLLSPSRCMAWNTPIPYRLRMALEAFQRAARRLVPPTADDLAVLGRMLLPDTLTDELTSDTYLLLSPHRELHSIPWAALRPGYSSEPLANLCVPAVIPSLQNLMIIWERDATHITLGR